jgi:hypothetical protein
MAAAGHSSARWQAGAGLRAALLPSYGRRRQAGAGPGPPTKGNGVTVVNVRLVRLCRDEHAQLRAVRHRRASSASPMDDLENARRFSAA